MRFVVRVRRSGVRDGLAPVEWLDEDGRRRGELDLQYSRFGALPAASVAANDFLLLAAAVYALDKAERRNDAGDCWTRELSVCVPVSDAPRWRRASAELETCIGFLTGDNWNFEFTEREAALVRGQTPAAVRTAGADAICLFSGGLDSLVGAIDWLESHGAGQLVLVGHHDGQMGGPYGDQRLLLSDLAPAYPERLASVLVRVGTRNRDSRGQEITLRSRSLLFLALGLVAASAFGENTPVYMPENGAIALNLPLTPSRRGSCSTRTAHPYFLKSLADVLLRVGVRNPLSNPLGEMTKGECVSRCRGRTMLERTARKSVSCAKRGHKRCWTHRDARACGRCMPCIYRRAALHTVGWDDELYGDDFCNGEGQLHSGHRKSGSDLRACLRLLRAEPSASEVSSLLIASGSLAPERLEAHTQVVIRAIAEIRDLIRDKAIPDVRRIAGL